MKDLKKIATNQYVYSIITKVSIVILGFLFTVVQSRYLGSEIKGQATYMSSIVSISSVVLGFGIHQAYPYYKKKTNGNLISTFLSIALLQLILYSMISFVCLKLNLPDEIKGVLIITPIMVYNKAISYLTIVENPNKKNTIETIINILDLCLVLALWKLTPPSFLIGLIIIVFKDLSMSIIYSFNWRKSFSFNKEQVIKWLPELVKFGFFPMLSLLMTMLNYRIDVIMLKTWVPDAAIGVYSVGVSLAERVWMIPDAMKEVMTSKIAKGKTSDEVAFVIRICNTACLFVMLGLIILGQPFINIVFGVEYSGAYQITLILLAGVFFMNYYKMIATYNIVMGKQSVNMAFLTASVVANIVVNRLVIPVYGIYGAAISSVVSYALCSFLFIAYFRKVTGIGISKICLINKEDIGKVSKRLKGVHD